MRLYILDTDIAGFIQSGHPIVLEHIKLLSADSSIVTTIITFGEDLSGWMPACRRATDGKTRAQAYSRLYRGIRFYNQISCLPFDDAAANVFDDLRSQQKLRIGTNDLSIAAITLSVGGVLITRNTKDFERVPNLVFEDWTR